MRQTPRLIRSWISLASCRTFWGKMKKSFYEIFMSFLFICHMSILLFLCSFHSATASSLSVEFVSSRFSRDVPVIDVLALQRNSLEEVFNRRSQDVVAARGRPESPVRQGRRNFQRRNHRRGGVFWGNQRCRPNRRGNRN